MFDFFARWLSRFPFARNSLRIGLSTKLVLLIALASVIGVLVSASLVLTLQRQHLINDALESTTRQSKLVNASLEQAMLRNDRMMLAQMMQAMVDEQSIEHIRILDSHGVVQISSSPTDVGERFDYSRSACLFCHDGRPRPSTRSSIGTTVDQHDALLNVYMIYNETPCQSCHDSKNQILGITIIEVPLTDLNHQLEEGFWRILLAAIATLALMIPLMTIAIQKVILKPVGELTRGMTEVRGGNLDCEIHVQNQDELGDLADTFNMMRDQLKTTRAENAELYNKVQYLAILKERDRLARELHDNLAQMLGYINIKSALTDDLLAKNQISQAQSNLLELKRIAKEAYTDVRESIFHLRNADSSGDDLISTLNSFLSEYRTQYGIDARLCVEDERLTAFPSEVQVQVNRIIQEALTNVRKHSQATQAWVRFERVDHHVRIGIVDDGKGFDPSQLGKDGSRHFGLQIMRERAESVGGELAIDSQIGSGTRVILHVPIFPFVEGSNENTSYFVGR